MPSSAHASRSDPIGASAAASSRARLTRAGLRRVIWISSLGCAISIDLPPAPPFVTENAEPSIRSENQLERKLDTAGPTASQEGIAYPHIPSCRERQVAHAATRPIANAAGRRIGDEGRQVGIGEVRMVDRKSTRLNSSHLGISYAVFCLKKKSYQQPEVNGDPPISQDRVTDS